MATRFYLLPTSLVRCAPDGSIADKVFEELCDMFGSKTLRYRMCALLRFDDQPATLPMGYPKC
jgi:hypothetical protein